MQKKGQLKILFIINPVSGGREKHDWEARIRNFFENASHTMEFYLLTGDNDAESITHHIESVGPDRVVTVGGDGTVKLVAELLAGTNIPLGIIPAGSANGMARELNIPLDLDEAIDVVVGDSMKAIDMVCINDEEYSIHLSDIGLNAMLVKYFEGSKKRGMWGYARSVFRVLRRKQRMYVTIETDEGIAKRKAFMVVIANARKYGTGANINPDGDISDGYFEVVVLRRLNIFEILKALFTNRSFDPDRIEVFKTTRALVTTLKHAYFQVDGEYRGKTNRIEAKMRHSALKVMVPGEG